MTRIAIVDRNADLIAAIAALSPPSDVTYKADDIFVEPADAIVSPANSFGFMDGGIDLAYSRRFGWHVQEDIQAKIKLRFEGEMLVGQAVSTPTGDPQFRMLIAAPTMRVPMRILDPTAVRLATRAAIREAIRIGAESVVMPGMGSGSGAVKPDWAAKMMMAGIRDALAPLAFPSSFAAAQADHFAAYATSRG